MSTPKNIWELDFTTLKLILDNSYDEISLINAQGVVVYVNPVCEKNYGLKADEVIGTHIAELNDNGMFDCCIGAQVIEEKRQIITQQNTRSGKHFLVSAVPIFNDAGDLTFIVTNSRDITDFKRALAKIRNQKRELAQFEGKLKSLSLELMESRGFIARSQKMEDVIRKAKTYAMVDSTVLMTCETGTGKSLFAHLIHEMGARAAKRMVSINCAAIPSELLETELFGYEPGAFTGAANRGKPGMFELADGGTLFLDEIGELPPPMQAKLLHALQDRVIRRLGSTRDIPVDVRLICATNRDLTKMVQDRLFRQDLYYRIKVLHLQLPALRERQEDIIPLACHFLEKFGGKYGKTHRMEQAALKTLKAYPWPGNIRELENVMEELAVTLPSGRVTLDDLPANVRDAAPRAGSQVQERTFDQTMEDTAKTLIVRAYAEYGSSYAVARHLNISQSKASRLIRKYIGAEKRIKSEVKR